MLKPKVGWDDVYPPGTAATLYTPKESGNWLPAGEWLSSYPLPLAGNVPIVVHESIAHEEVLAMLRSLSSTFSTRLEIVANQAECRARLLKLVEQGYRIHAEYCLPSDWLPASAYLVDPGMFTSLNNKADLERWVPEGCYPKRFPIKMTELRTRNPFATPYAIKAISQYGSGGAIDVKFCENAAGKITALEYFKKESEVIVEEWIQEARLFCVQGVVLKDRSYTSLGSSEQICDERGSPLYNWIDQESEVGAEGQALAESIIRKAGKAGYFGFAGIDILKAKDGTLKVIDLNFRSCYSTRGLVFYEELKGKWGWDCVTVRSLTTPGNPIALMKVMATAIAEKRAYPWSMHLSEAALKMTFLTGGRSRQKACERLDLLKTQLAACGQ